MILITEQKEKAGPRVVALGTFDGVHRGHQALLRQGSTLAKQLGVPLRVCTFDRHPLEVLRDAPPMLLNSGAEKQALMAAFGVDELRLWSFDLEMAAWSPDRFLDALALECAPCSVVIGWNYTFGRGGKGNAALLRAEGARRGWQTVVVPCVRTAGGEVISSSAIRRKLQAGDLDGAEEMLGYAWPISGKVRLLHGAR